MVVLGFGDLGRVCSGVAAWEPRASSPGCPAVDAAAKFAFVAFARFEVCWVVHLTILRGVGNGRPTPLNPNERRNSDRQDCSFGPSITVAMRL